MSQAPYQWSQTGSCVACGAPIFGRLRKPGAERFEEEGTLETPEAQRTCPASCPHGAVKAVEKS